MKLIYKYWFSEVSKRYEPHCLSYESKKRNLPSDPDYTTDFEEERILSSYLFNLEMIEVVRSIANKLRSPFVKQVFIGSEVWDAEIVGDEVQMRFVFASEDPEDEDYQPLLILPRKEVAYAVDKWLAFLQREIDPDYSEIIDTEEAYR